MAGTLAAAARIALPLLLACAALASTANRAGAAPLRTLNFEQLSVKDGLAQATVTAIVQDQQGTMWFGSQHGLSRYDGHRITVYQTIASNPRSLADNWIQALYVDRKNRLWVGSRGGLQRFDPASGDFTSFPAPTGAGAAATNAAPDAAHDAAPDAAPDAGTHAAHSDAGAKRRVHAIISDGYGQLWIAGNDGLQHFDPDSGRSTMLRHDPAQADSLADDHVNALARDADGNLWVGLKTGLDRLSTAPGKTTFTHFRTDTAAQPNAAENEIAQLWIDQHQQLWIVSMDGIATWQLGAQIVRHPRYGPAQGLLPGLVTALMQDRDNNIWLGTNSNGLQRWDAASGRFVIYPADPRSVAANEVSALFQDHTGTLWVGTWTAGLKRVDLASGGFNRFYHVPGASGTLPDNRIFGIAGDGQGGVLLASMGGLSRYDPASGLVTPLRADAGLRRRLRNNELVLSTYRDGHGALWVGTSAGLGRYDPASGAFRPHSFAHADPNSDSITHITADRDGVLWVSSRGGLHRYDPASGGERSYRHAATDASSLSDDWVRMTLQDRHGAIWVATDDGLNRLDDDGKGFQRYRHDSRVAGSLASDRVQYLFEDAGGTLWVGTNGGLSRMERDAGGAVRFHNYGTADGLAADSIGGILQADDGALWLSTGTSISRLRTGADGVASFKNYTVADGLIDGYYYAGSAYRGADGSMYFGGVNGLTVFRPDAIHDNPYPPPVRITQVRVAGTALAPPDGRRLVLAHDQATLGFDFAALHYADPQRNRYRYQLQGFDKNWISTDASQPGATYTNLDPGDYVLRVAAANKDGLWSPTPATLSFTITAPYWQTWWFRGAAALLLVALAWSGDRARVRIHARQTRRLESQVSARTAQVEQQKEELQQAQHQLQRYVADRERLFIAISHDLRTPITRLKLRSELLDDDAVRDEFHDDLDDLDMMVKGALQTVKDSDIHENVTTVRLDPLIQRMLRSAQLAGHHIAYEDSGCTVTGRPLALKRAIGNLLDNALFYGERADISVADDVDGMVRITIRDHGPGIPDEAIAQLFEPNARLDHGRRQNAGGLGLGLGIARGIITAHGGTLTLSNHRAGGLLATIHLPRGQTTPDLQ